MLMLRWYRATPPPAIDTTWPHQFFTMKKFIFLDDFYVYLLRIELKLNELIRNLFSFFRFQVCSSVNRNFHENRMRHENNAHHHNHQTLLLKQIGRAGRGSAPHPQASASNSLGTIHILSDHFCFVRRKGWEICQKMSKHTWLWWYSLINMWQFQILFN